MPHEIGDSPTPDRVPPDGAARGATVFSVRRSRTAACVASDPAERHQPWSLGLGISRASVSSRGFASQRVSPLPVDAGGEWRAVRCARDECDDPVDRRASGAHVPLQHDDRGQLDARRSGWGMGRIRRVLRHVAERLWIAKRPIDESLRLCRLLRVAFGRRGSVDRPRAGARVVADGECGEQRTTILDPPARDSAAASVASLTITCESSCRRAPRNGTAMASGWLEARERLGLEPRGSSVRCTILQALCAHSLELTRWRCVGAHRVAHAREPADPRRTKPSSTRGDRSPSR